MPSLRFVRRPLLVGFSLLMLTAPSAGAATIEEVPAANFAAGQAIFAVPSSQTTVRSAHLRTGRSLRPLKLGRVRRAMNEGVLRVRTSATSDVALVLRYKPPRKRRPVQPPPAPPVQPPSNPAPPTNPAPPPAGDPIPAGAKFVAAGGSDSNAGTQAAPWKTLSKALSSARPGDTVVLRSGSYGALGTTSQVSLSGTSSAPITFMGYPGEAKPEIKGYVRITGSHLRFSGVLFDGPTGPVLARNSSNPKGEEVQVSVMYGTDVEISRSEIRENGWHAGIFVYDATNVRVVGNYIHDNGDRSDSSQANLDHGVYWSSGSGLVANNVIENNFAYGVHLYPDAAGVVVEQNTIVGNDKGGVIIAEAAANNRVLNNVIAGNALSGIKGYALTGGGNVAQGNLLWSNSRNFEGAGIALSSNKEADPQFVGPGDYRLRSTSPAINAALPGHSTTADYAGKPRITGGAADIGAYEAG
jgi:hypothetical protein